MSEVQESSTVVMSLFIHFVMTLIAPDTQRSTGLAMNPWSSLPFRVLGFSLSSAANKIPLPRNTGMGRSRTVSWTPRNLSTDLAGGNHAMRRTNRNATVRHRFRAYALDHITAVQINCISAANRQEFRCKGPTSYDGDAYAYHMDR